MAAFFATPQAPPAGAVFARVVFWQRLATARARAPARRVGRGQGWPPVHAPRQLVGREAQPAGQGCQLFWLVARILEPEPYHGP